MRKVKHKLNDKTDMNNKTDHDNKILKIIIVIPLKYHSQVHSKKNVALLKVTSSRAKTIKLNFLIIETKNLLRSNLNQSLFLLAPPQKLGSEKREN